MIGNTLTPAYGRDYKSGQAALKDFKEGKDFQLATTGQYCSVRDLELLGGGVVIRYNKLRDVITYRPER